ncbi:hypothetical protein [Mesorhizobium dulcispinae]|uniref:hypothetical protein n=1 Tax=Mesorhizobium dulcispinae TaxID=3072316 RepID=UPI002A247698|nr:hypothetical protein [Mesorhizobium sp. VK23D]MDX8517957.1 hypothetical protein [Mesorhizobium sp. VK23D]
MEIVNHRPARPGNNVRAFFDVRFDNGIFVRDLRLVETRSGLRVYGPTKGGETIVTIPPAVADIIVEAVAHERA